MLEQKNPSKNIGAVVGIAEKLSLMQDSVPQIKEQKYILDKVQTNEFWEKAFILEMDVVREALRDLIQFLPKKTQRIVYTDFADHFFVAAGYFVIYALPCYLDALLKRILPFLNHKGMRYKNSFLDNYMASQRLSKAYNVVLCPDIYCTYNRI